MYNIMNVLVHSPIEWKINLSFLTLSTAGGALDLFRFRIILFDLH